MNRMKKEYEIICDTREKSNLHILNTFEKKNIPYKVEGLITGDYRIRTTDKNYKSSLIIERKASINELISNLFEKPREGEQLSRFEKELKRAYETPNMKLLLLIEDKDGYEKMLRGDYISKANPNAITGRLMALKARYGFELVFIDLNLSPSFIFRTLYYDLREKIKEGK